jgi:hypothetical protein
MKMLSQILESSLPEQIIILIIAALPIVELRGSIPVAMDVFHMSWQQSVALSIIGNLIPVPFLLLFYDSLARFGSRIKVGKTFLEWLYKRTRRQTGIIEKYKYWAYCFRSDSFSRNRCVDSLYRCSLSWY